MFLSFWFLHTAGTHRMEGWRRPVAYISFQVDLETLLLQVLLKVTKVRTKCVNVALFVRARNTSAPITCQSTDMIVDIILLKNGMGSSCYFSCQCHAVIMYSCKWGPKQTLESSREVHWAGEVGFLNYPFWEFMDENKINA